MAKRLFIFLITLTMVGCAVYRSSEKTPQAFRIDYKAANPVGMTCL
jgi:hypothetical protein